MMEVKNIGVLGSGSWGTAMIKMLTENSENILWHVRNDNQAKHIIKTGKNPNYLKNLKIDINKVFISSKLDEIIKKSDVIIITIPSPYIHKNLIEYKSILKSKVIYPKEGFLVFGTREIQTFPLGTYNMLLLLSTI